MILLWKDRDRLYEFYRCADAIFDSVGVPYVNKETGESYYRVDRDLMERMFTELASYDQWRLEITGDDLLSPATVAKFEAILAQDEVKDWG